MLDSIGSNLLSGIRFESLPISDLLMSEVSENAGISVGPDISGK